MTRVEKGRNSDMGVGRQTSRVGKEAGGGGSRREVMMERFLGKHNLYILHVFRMLFCSNMEQYCGCVLCGVYQRHPFTSCCMFICQLYSIRR